ncbi:hypothetical protein E3T55_03135 [Cryobacterium frigoriphilum]|uniref:Uncharacterized protein n=1 Tax=Cryobacterium frigoriphilum TaxID=1259150 RepID=A0A4R9A9S7_9MICO|nr:hypothetical protein [Cryobacterium frigoriphilum]TFD54445.1 hypothetical protein E3T55_03135 [Cryobacterium frigoriphilum]
MPVVSEPTKPVARARATLGASVVVDRGSWSGRRWLLAAGIAVVAVVALIAAGGLIGPADALPGGSAVAPWWALPVVVVGSALAALVVASYVGTPIGADATLCDTRWPALGLTGLYLATELRSLEPVLGASTDGPVRPVVALAAIGLLVWALRARLMTEHRATAALAADVDAQPGEVCTTCRPLFARTTRPAASAAPTTESHP